MKKLCATLILVVIFNLGFGFASPTPARADTFDAILDVLDAVSTYALVREMIKKTEFTMQNQVFQETKQNFGVSRDVAANDMLHRIFTRVGVAPGNEEVLARPPSYFIIPDGSINGFRSIGNVIGINLGVFHGLGFNEDMVAFIVTHEIGHGTKQHSLRQIEGVLPLKVVAQLIAKRYGEYIPAYQLQLAGLVLLHIRNSGYSVPFEYEADNTGFEYAVNAGYNPGGAAAAFVRMKLFYEDKPDLLRALFNPRTHPTHQQRIENFSSKLTAYSGNNVTVNGTAVNVRGRLLLNARPIGARLAEERAFLVAGNLARVFHQSPRPTEPATVEFGTLKLAGRTIITPVPGEPSAEELQARLNAVLGFPAVAPGMPAADKPKPLNSHWIEL
ncbi:M48 family metallopeptidase [Anaeroselena agilis]|uniref:M48 family metallopeptidase n=1 Tax=Anaeroselena agilis TaxID=3063788 RepID=A0ABU3NVL1_9FIRM|nr:M48 family metallopeptidase [Selenomonadales bacterium 4137-cl]